MIERRRVAATKTIVTNGHKYVDLALPSGTLWATMNVGASIVTDYGYYMNGKTTYFNGWGGSWHKPSKEQFEELIDNCGITRSDGGIYFSRYGESVFFPAAGNWYYYENIIEYTGSYGQYWSCTDDDTEYPYYMFFNMYTGEAPYVSNNYYKNGFSIRLVIG